MAKEIKASEVRALMSAGKNRKEIAEHFGVSQSEMKRKVWDHAAFKNKKVNNTPVNFIDDEGDTATSTEQETATVETTVADTAQESADASEAVASNSEAEGSWQ